MRKLLLLLAFISGAVHADEWWETDTTAGGKIIITMQTADWCPKGFFIGYLETSKQDAVYGCWALINQRIHMKYNNGVSKVYDLEGWVRRVSKGG